MSLEILEPSLAPLAMPTGKLASLPAATRLIFALIERSRLILDRHIGASRRFVLAADVVGDLLILGLLEGGLVVLLALA